MADKTLQEPTIPRDRGGPGPGRGGRGRGKPFPGGVEDCYLLPKPLQPIGLVGFLVSEIAFLDPPWIALLDSSPDSSPGLLSWIPLLDSSPGFLSQIPKIHSWICPNLVFSQKIANPSIFNRFFFFGEIPESRTYAQPWT